MHRKKMFVIFVPLFIALLFLISELTLGHKTNVVPIELHWGCGEATQYPVDITNGRWDTTELVAQSEIEVSSIRVVVDGDEIDYWLSDFNSDHTSVWVNLDFAIDETGKEIEIHYSDMAGLPMIVDNNTKPIFNLETSTNAVWDYDQFGDDAGLRAGRWSFALEYDTEGDKYTANHQTNANPWDELGINLAPVDYMNGRWSLHNPCGLASVDFQNGEQYREVTHGNMYILIQSNDGSAWETEWYVDTVTASEQWVTWNQYESLNANTTDVSLFFVYAVQLSYFSFSQANVEVDDVEVTITTPPTIILNPIHYHFPAIFK